MNVLVIHGPNLNLLGAREPQIYGGETLSEIDASLERLAGELGLTVSTMQSNHEGELVEAIQGAVGKVDAILILSATQLLLSSTSLASLPTLPSSELPEGSFALMLALIGALRGARAIAVFVMFGWQPLQKAWLWAHTVIRRAGRT